MPLTDEKKTNFKYKEEKGGTRKERYEMKLKEK
jgi:hypothetical protein